MYEGHFPELCHAGGLRPPPFAVTDEAGREITIREYGSPSATADYEDLVELYRSFDPAHRSLGIPPTTEPRIRRWLDAVLTGYCVLALHESRPIGQAVLVEDEAGAYELAIFVHQDYHGAGIGTHLLEATLSVGKRGDVERVWLLVERDNRVALALYDDVGFCVVDDSGPDLEMALTL